MAIIQCFYKLFQSFISNFELIISQKDDELANLKAKIKSLSKKNSTLKKKIKSLHETLTESKPDDSISPKYGYFEVDKPPIVTKDNIPSLNYLELIEGKTIKSSKIFFNGNLPNPEQLCPRCESPAKFHAIHTKTQKLCKCCNYHFSYIKPHTLKKKNTVFKCPYCNHSLSHRVKRSHFDVYVCKNKSCSHRLDALKDVKHHRDKISYIYRHINLEIDDVFKVIEDSTKTDAFSLRFRKFNMDIFSKIITLKVNLKLSNRTTAIAMLDLFNISISHTQVANYCTAAAHLISLINENTKTNPSDQLVADETYIKVNGKKHYVWIIMDVISGSVVASHISDKRDTTACVTAIVKAIKQYDVIPSTIHFASDAYTAYPLALQYVFTQFPVTFKHTSVKGIEVQNGEDSNTRKAKQLIERLNRTFKESYRVTTGFGTIKGSRLSFQLWMFYYNYLRKRSNKLVNSLNFISNRSIVDNLVAPVKWSLALDYSIKNLVT
jgi:transposase-like protein/regulator of replication initiation timing